MIALSAALCACSVKENRSVCPCELTVRSAEALSSKGNVLVSVIQDGVVVKQGMMSRDDFERDGCILTVPRKPSTVTVFTGITEMNTVSGRTLGIREDNQCDELYSGSAEVLPLADTCLCTVFPHKNYASLFLEVIGMPKGGTVKVVGKVRGYDLMDLSPSGGYFAFAPDESADGLFKCVLRLPRQVDDSLVLEVLRDGEVIQTIEAGKLILESGYSFEEENLPDIMLTVDLTRSAAIIRVADWEESDSVVQNI